MRGRRPGNERAADQRARRIEASFRAAGGGQCGNSAGRRILRLEQCVRAEKALAAEGSLPGSELQRRTSEKSAGKLQVAIPLSDDDRGTAGSRGTQSEQREDHRLDAGPHGVWAAR